MAGIHGDILIERPPEAVFDFVADERNEPRFNPRMATSCLESGAPVREGSRFRATLRSLGRAVPMTVELTFEPEGSGTRLRWTWEVKTSGLARVAGPLVAHIGKRQERQTWEGLKSLLEAGGPGSSPV